MSSEKSRLLAIRAAIANDSVEQLTKIADWTSLIGRIPFILRKMVAENRLRCLDAVLASDADVDVNALDDHGRSLLDFAVSVQCYDTALILRRHMARRPIHQVHRPDGSIESMLYTACSERRIDDVKRLLARDDIDLNKGVAGGTTTLMLVAGGLFGPPDLPNGAIPFVDLLVNDARCDVNVQNEDGLTALHFAADTDSVDVVRALRVDRCDPTIECKNGGTALHRCISPEIYVVVGQFMVRQANRKSDAKAAKAVRRAKIEKEVQDAKEAAATELLRAQEKRRDEPIAARPPPQCANCQIVGTAVDVLLMPCRHLCLCTACAKIKRKAEKAEKTRKCPVCDENVTKYRTVYW